MLDCHEADQFFGAYMADDIRDPARGTNPDDAAQTYIEQHTLSQSMFSEIRLYFMDLDSGNQ